jgi:hypothetical protein
MGGHIILAESDLGWRRFRWGLPAIVALLCAGARQADAAQFGMPIGSQPGYASPGEQNQGGQNQGEQNQNEEKPGQPPFLLGGLLDDFHTERQKLKDMGITFSLHERSEVWADVSGGGHQGVSYNGLTIAKLNLDLDALFGWSGGELFTSAFDIHGHGPSRSFVGNRRPGRRQ